MICTLSPWAGFASDGLSLLHLESAGFTHAVNLNSVGRLAGLSVSQCRHSHVCGLPWASWNGWGAWSPLCIGLSFQLSLECLGGSVG